MDHCVVKDSRPWRPGASSTRKCCFASPPHAGNKQYTMRFLVWLLCALDSAPCWRINVLFLLVGRTHIKLDRFLSRIVVALAGRGYFTVVGMCRQLQPSLSRCTVKSNHLSQVWAWRGLMEHPCTRGTRNLDPVHAFRFERSGGIYVQWKQWCTDESRGKNIACASRADFYIRFVPPCLPRHGFPIRRPAHLGMDS